MDEKMEGRHNHLIDLLRIVFTCCVLLHHGVWVREPGLVPMSGGSLSVEFFFILSGYLLARRVSRKTATDEKSIALDTVAEIKKRIIRMLPYTIPAYLLSYPMTFWGWSRAQRGGYSFSSQYIEYMAGADLRGYAGHYAS